MKILFWEELNYLYILTTNDDSSTVMEIYGLPEIFLFTILKCNMPCLNFKMKSSLSNLPKLNLPNELKFPKLKKKKKEA